MNSLSQEIIAAIGTRPTDEKLREWLKLAIDLESELRIVIDQLKDTENQISWERAHG